MFAPAVNNAGHRPDAVRQRPHWSEALAHPIRSFHTVRHLHAKQIIYRALRSVQPVRRTTFDRPVPSMLRRTSVHPCDVTSSMFDGRSFCFLNRRIVWGGSDRWQPAGADDLWVFNLHYFRYLPGIPSHAAQALLADWMSVHHGPHGAGWHPYPISIRVREWTEWLCEHRAADPALRWAMTESIARQVECLSHRLELDVMGNHLLENAITLCWAGLSFAGMRADEWLSLGARLFLRELRNQTLPDGSHYERSPMYQALLAEAILRLSEVAGQSAKPKAAEIHAASRDAGRRMLRSLARMVHPDGQYALVNDTAFGVAPTLESLTARFGIPVEVSDPRRHLWSLGASGYAGYCHEQDRYLIFNAGPIGPNHQPGHGHADMLSFELSSRGRRVITDTGVMTYAPGAARRHDRSTAAHNTIEIDGHDQSELWGAFRCGRRPSVARMWTEERSDGATLLGRYRGPRRRWGAVGHERRIFSNGRLLAFSDVVTAAGPHSAAVRLHVAPGLQLRRSRNAWTIVEPGGRPIAALAGDGLPWSESASPYHPEFGREVERPCLHASVSFRDRLNLKWLLTLS